MFDFQSKRDGQVAQRLRPRWQKLATSQGVPADAAAALYAELVQRYSGPNRFYHDLHHVEEVLHALNQLRFLAIDYDALQLAVWYHDVIYERDELDNEWLSAQFAVTKLGRYLDRAVCRRVEELILDTRHRQPPATLDGRIIVDADLASLAAAPDYFRQRSRDVRREYSHVPEDLYRSSRIELLQGFLQRENVYYTTPMRRCCDRRARENLRHAIGILKDGGFDF